MIKDAAHHLDLRSSDPNDTAAVIAARKKEKATVKRWLHQYWKHPSPTTAQVQYGDITNITNIVVKNVAFCSR